MPIAPAGPETVLTKPTLMRSAATEGPAARMARSRMASVRMRNGILKPCASTPCSAQTSVGAFFHVYHHHGKRNARLPGRGEAAAQPDDPLLVQQQGDLPQGTHIQCRRRGGQAALRGAQEQRAVRI